MIESHDYAEQPTSHRNSLMNASFDHRAILHTVEHEEPVGRNHAAMKQPLTESTQEFKTLDVQTYVLRKTSRQKSTRSSKGDSVRSKPTFPAKSSKPPIKTAKNAPKPPKASQTIASERSTIDY